MYPITIAQLKRTVYTQYSLWDGEQIAHVHLNLGAHGGFSAAIVVEHMDSPMEVHKYDGYDRCWERNSRERRFNECLQWIADTLNKMAEGIEFVVGDHSEIEYVHKEDFDHDVEIE